jgi:hypothetical protein
MILLSGAPDYEIVDFLHVQPTWHRRCPSDRSSWTKVDLPLHRVRPVLCSCSISNGPTTAAGWRVLGRRTDSQRRVSLP